MGAEHSQQRAEADGREIFEDDLKTTTAARPATAVAASKRRSLMLRQGSSSSNNKNSSNSGATAMVNSPTISSRAPSPPLSVCSDLPYVSYTDRPIGGDSPKMRSKPPGSSANSAARAASRKSHPSGTKPKRPQSTASTIVIVKPGARDNDLVDSDLARLRNIPQFLPVLRESITSATFVRDPEVLERLQSQHLLNICARMQTHLNVCATLVATEQNHLVERTKVVSNSITTLFASFVDMQKTYAAYAEQFNKIRTISHTLSRCNSMLHENIASLEAINDFLDVDDRLEPFLWRTDDSKLRGEAEGACSIAASGTVVRRGRRM